MKHKAEPTYTLTDAARIIRMRECATNGHDWNIHTQMGPGPTSLSCGTCGWGGRITMRERPAIT